MDLDELSPDGVLDLVAGLVTATYRMAAATVSTGRRREHLPATAAAFADGALSATHARVVTRAMTPGRIAEAAEAGIDLADTDRILADLARACTPPSQHS
jgi:hypothetical protein